MDPQRKKRIVFVVRALVSAGLLVLVISMVPLRDRVQWRKPAAQGAETVEIETSYGEILNRTDVDPGVRFVIRMRPADSGEILAIPRDRLVGDLEGIQWGLIYVVKNVHVPLLLLAIAPMLLSPLFTGIRWHGLLRAQGIPIRLVRTLRLNWCGMFFNNVMFGLTGGDVVKAWFVARETERKAAAVTTVFLDRVIGLTGMLAMAAVATLFVLDVPEMREASRAIVVLMLAVAAGALVFFSRRLRRRLGLEWLLARVPAARHVQKIDRAVMLYRHRPWTLVASMMWSVLNQVSIFVGLYILSRAMGMRVPLVYFFVLPPIVTIVSALPINVAGWGVGEWMFAQLFALVGVGAAQAVSMSVLFRICQTVLVSLPGALMIPGRRPAADRLQAEVDAAEAELGESDSRPVGEVAS